jgi:hypothetical protein
MPMRPVTMVLLKTILLSLQVISVAAADVPLVNCAPQLPPASCSALAAGSPLAPRAVTAVPAVKHEGCSAVPGGVLEALLQRPGCTSLCSSYLVPCTVTVSTTITPEAR